MLAWTGPHLGDGGGVGCRASTPRPLARAAKGRASFDWQYSKGEDLRLFGRRTVRAEVTLSGLARGAVYYDVAQTLTALVLVDGAERTSLLRQRVNAHVSFFFVFNLPAPRARRRS